MLTLVLLSVLTTTAFGQSSQYDILIKNGRVIDGTGNPWYYADVGVNGDRIAAIGDLSNATGRDTIDATGLVVAPGFIDMHTHVDDGFGDPDRSATMQGVGYREWKTCVTAVDSLARMSYVKPLRKRITIEVMSSWSAPPSLQSIASRIIVSHIPAADVLLHADKRNTSSVRV